MSRSAHVVVFTDAPGWHGKALTAAFAERGFTTHYVSLSECSISCGDGRPRIELPGLGGRLPHGAFVRGIAGGTLEEIIFRLDILHCLEILNVAVFNSGRAIERTVDKALTSFLLDRHGLPCATTWVCESSARGREIAGELFASGRAAVLKPLFGSQGDGIVLLPEMKAFEAAVPVRGVYYLQEYLDRYSEPYRDWRVFVIAGQAVAAMQREGPHWITNRAQGARCHAVTLDNEMCQLAEAAARIVAVDYAGVDLMRDRRGDWVIGEVNGIPAWQGLQRVTKHDLSAALVEALLNKARHQYAVQAVV